MVLQNFQETVWWKEHEWWLVFATAFTGIAAISSALIILSQTRSKEKRIEKNYIVRIARLLSKLDLFLKSHIEIITFRDGANTSQFNDQQEIVDHIIAQILAYMDKINDRIKPRLFAEMESSLESIKSIFDDPKTFILMCISDAEKKSIQLEVVEAEALKKCREEIQLFLGQLKMSKFRVSKDEIVK